MRSRILLKRLKNNLAVPHQFLYYIDLMMNNNYLLIEMNRYEVGDSTVCVVTEDFITKWIKFRKKMGCTAAPIAKLKHEVKGWDEEEVTYLWLPTTKEVDKAGKTYMEEFMNEMEEDGII